MRSEYKMGFVFGVILKYKKMTERLRLFADAVAIFFFFFF